jgi:predicted transglutaminase-like cysteine proteinase
VAAYRWFACPERPDECVPGRFDDARVQVGPERMRELDAINRKVNAEIIAATDLDIYGENERWTLPKTRGDCEDYALLKRHLLIKQGWPVGALLMTVVRDETGEGHAVLTVRTAHGDLILDNKFDDIKPWHQVRYTFLMRQSYIDPKVWVSLDPKDARRHTVVSSAETSP